VEGRTERKKSRIRFVATENFQIEAENNSGIEAPLKDSHKIRGERMQELREAQKALLDC